MNSINKFFFLLIIVSGLFVTSCVDNDFDEPQNTLSIDDSEVLPISDILDLLPVSGGILLGEDNIGSETRYIKGTVTADDASGNFFKTITFQDATGALSIAADRNELNAEFQQGNTIFVKLNGLTLAYDANLPRLGASIENDRLQRIPDILVNDFMFAGGEGDVISPQVVTISEILQNANQYYNRLVTIEEAEFTLQFAGQTFADADNPEGPQTVNAMISDCDDNEIILRNSGFADFAREIMPSGSGTLTAIVSVFNNDLQLFIRDLNDIDFMELRCDGSGGQVDNEIEIEKIKTRYYELGADKAEAGFITGTVISDRNTGQVNFQNIFFQNGEHGILIRFTGEHSFDLGDQLKINVSGQEVSEFNNLLQINNVSLFSAEKIGSGELPDARELTVSEILADNNRYESTRVLIKGATLSGGSTYGAGNINVNDGSGQSISIFTFSTTSYANEPVPSGTVDVTAVVSQFGDNAQLLINAASDVVGGSIDPVETGDELTIKSIQDRYYDFGADSAEEGFITGTVISDRTTGQVNSQNVIVQNGESGILVRFTSDHSFNLGDQLKVVVSGQEVSEFRNVLQLNNIPLSNATTTGSGNLPAPNQLTIDEILMDNNRYESTRVLITDAMLSGGSTYGAGNITVDDGTETIVIFTFSTTSYANEPVPTGTVSVTAVLSQFDDTVQLMLNSADDVSGGSVDPGGNGSDGQVNQDFSGFSDFDPVSIGGWLNIATKGDRQWYTRSFDNNGFVECEAFQDDNPETEAWLVTPTIDTDDKSIFSFESAIAFWQHQGLSVWISQDFDNLSEANWIALDQAILANNSNDNYEFVASGDIDLKNFLSGKVRVGFLYQGTSSSNTTKVRIDNVELK